MKVIDDFTIEGRGRTAYDWDETKLFSSNGKVLEFEAKKDFSSKPASFIAAAQKEAKKRGGKVESRTDAKKGVVQMRYVPDKKK